MKDCTRNVSSSSTTSSTDLCSAIMNETKADVIDGINNNIMNTSVNMNTTCSGTTMSTEYDGDGDIILESVHTVHTLHTTGHPVVQIPSSSFQNKGDHGNNHNMTLTPHSGTVITPVGGVVVGNNGRIKSPPICLIPSLRKEHMTYEEISKWCFTHDDIWDIQSVCHDSSSSSSISSSNHRDCDNIDNHNGHEKEVSEGPLVGTISNSAHGGQDEEEEEGGDDDDILDNSDEIIDKVTMMKDDIIKNDKMDNTSLLLAEHGPQSPVEWESFKKKILNRNESRSGRETQRFANDEKTGQLLRLTTGCVPIMTDGKILLVSSGRKGEWILPKGGWEMDESMEGSALRETYEEGGILGVIGPKLSEVEFETRKAKKRRLELESLKKKYEIACGNTIQQHHPDANGIVVGSTTISIQSNASSVQSHSEDDQPSHTRESGGGGELQPPLLNNNNNATVTADRRLSASSPTNKECLATKIRNELHKCGIKTERHDDSASVASSTGSSSCTHVRLSMFPLYVLEVREHWPESGRARKVVDIDTAIETMSSRPEFYQVLMEVKQKGYHLKPQHQYHAEKNNVMDKDVQKIISGFEKDQSDMTRKETII